MPVDAKRYTRDWYEISDAAKERAGHRCTCEGECGVGHGGRCREHNGHRAEHYKGIVVLTTHHVNGLPWDNREENLKPMCQACHNRCDLPMRQAHAKETRLKSKRLQPLFQEHL